MTRPELRSGSDGNRNRSFAPRRFRNKLSLIDYRDDATSAELEKVMVHFAEDCFGKAILKMNAAVRVYEIVFVVVPEERSEAEAFNVKICFAKKAGATGA